MSRYKDMTQIIDPAQKDLEQLMAAYRLTFKSNTGMRVLGDLLIKLRFFEKVDPDRPEDVARHNLAIEILAMCEIIKTDKHGSFVTNAEKLVMKLFTADAED